ncbi:amino acid synthesis family protein [Ramlibacter sp.]|uniref:amino acid synthesis family protein n=1 Tax=Ramlibacter sp. TaxID=1917967 RepID=UPI003D133232
MNISIKRLYTVTDCLHAPDVPVGDSLRRFAVIAVVDNPYAGQFVQNLRPLIDASVPIGHRIGEELARLAGAYKVQSYGKGGIVGINGEQEHAAALLTSDFAAPVREAVGGGKAWISSMVKVGGPGTTIDVPLAHKDALYVRSHYDGMSLTVPECPMPDEIALIFCAATRGRLNARVGGLRAEDIQGRDGLV